MLNKNQQFVGLKTAKIGQHRTILTLNIGPSVCITSRNINTPSIQPGLIDLVQQHLEWRLTLGQTKHFLKCKPNQNFCSLLINYFTYLTEENFYVQHVFTSGFTDILSFANDYPNVFDQIVQTTYISFLLISCSFLA